MSLQSGRETNYCAQNEQDIGFKCDVCALTFRISSERNMHVLDHFQRENCSICSETLIRLGSIWYSIREHPNHNVNRNDIDSNDNDCGLETVFVDAVKSEPGPFYNEPTASQIEECHMVKTEIDNTTYQTEFVRVSDYNEPKPSSIVNTQETPSGDGDNFERNMTENDLPAIKTKGQCHLCMKKIVCASALKSHIYLHYGIKPFSCELCEKAFTDKRNLNTHRRSCKGKREQKSKQTKLKSDEEPQPASNFIELKPLNITDAWSTSADTQDALGDAEMLEDFEPNDTPSTKTKKQCHICKKEIACATSLKYHMNIHLGIKPFVCGIRDCDKAFADRRNLLKHSRMHTSESALVPASRERKSKNKSTNNSKLGQKAKRIPDNVQQESLDVEVDEKIEDTIAMPEIKTKGQCHICMKKIVCASSLQYHLNVHFRVKPYPCPNCDKTFADKRNLNKHRRLHTEIKADEPNYNIRDLYEDDNLAGRESENTDWVCEYCNTEFKLEIYLAKHIVKDHDDQKTEHSCNICIEKFSSLSHLLAHMRAHPESTQHKCTFEGCEHGFAYKVSLSSHVGKHKLINGHVIRKTQDDVRAIMLQEAANRMDGARGMDNGTPDEDTTCTICSRKFPCRSILQHHIQTTHNNERFKCLGCDRIFKGKTTAMTKHIEMNHPELIRACQTCKKVFYSDTKLAEHQRRHNSFTCSICSETFTLKHRFIQHMNSHEKEAKCDICSKKFSSVKRMMTHRMNHEHKKMIKCRFPGCTMAFEKRREFMLHASEHPVSGRNRSVCPYCGKAISKSFLKDHMNIHTGARPYECSICQQKFALSGSLARHALIHTNIKPYACDVDGCTQAYRDSIDLKRHKFSVHKIYTKKHICSICSKVFSERKLLRYHIVKVHDKVEHESVLQMDQSILN